MRRRRPIGIKKYTISFLLEKQPKAICRDKYYRLMISYYRESTILKRIRFNRRCYSLLNDAVIRPEHLHNFYKTYNLPQDPFFPLFLLIKNNYFVTKDIRKREKQQYIQGRMRELSPHVDSFFKIIYEMEKRYNRAGQTPVYKKYIIPKTKKHVDRLAGYKHLDWFFFFSTYLEMLLKQYKRISYKTTGQLAACFMLECIPETFSDLPDQSLVNNHYRSFSKKYHPDVGGDPEFFIEIKRAHEVLLGE